MRGLMMVCALALMAGGAEAAIYRYDYVGPQVNPGDPTSVITASATFDLGKVSDVDGNGYILFSFASGYPAQADGIEFGPLDGIASVEVSGIDPFTTSAPAYLFFEITTSGRLQAAELNVTAPGDPTRLLESYSFFAPDGSLQYGFEYYSYLIDGEYQTYTGTPGTWTRTVLVPDPVLPAVPLPASAGGLALALLGLFGLRRRA